MDYHSIAQKTTLSISIEIQRLRNIPVASYVVRGMMLVVLDVETSY